ncbi:MAG: T9SS type A sorting domain-containing protein [Bacteroidetes bacterium]|nr:T9SS type A sorting domain-containing protein [Bacteroidota bacterium]
MEWKYLERSSGSTATAAKKLLAGAGPTIYAMNWSATGNNIIVYTVGANLWTALSNSTLNAIDIAVGDAGKVLAVDALGKLYFRFGGAWVLDATAPADLIRVSAASDGTVMLLTSSGVIYKNTWANINCGASLPVPVNTTASQNLNICSGQSTTLTATGTGTLNWSGPSSGTGATLVTPSLTTSATYSITNTLAGCTSLPTVVTVTVNSLTPPLFSGPSSISICSGTSTSLTASGTGTISWFASPTSTTALTTGTVYTTPTLTSNTSYYISAITNGCESTRAVKTITITPLPAQPVNITTNIGLQNSVCQGFSCLVLNRTANGNWYTTATGGTSFLFSTQYTTPTTLTTNTTYYVDQTVNGCTSTPRVAIELTVTPIPSVLSQTVQNLTCNGSGNRSISLTLNNPSSFIYDWTPNVSTTYSATSLAAGIYTVQISSGAGLCVTTQTYNVTQPAAYNVPISIIGGNILNFNDSYAGGTTFQWLDCNNGNAQISGAVNAQFTPTVSGSYALVVTDNCASTSTCTSILITGLNENAELNNITLQPNPASTFFTLDNVIEGTMVNVIDVTGKVVASTSSATVGNIADKTMTIETSNLSNGIYVIQLKNNGAVAHKKLIVSK